MADKLVKVNLLKADCRNIYFVNNNDTSAPTYINRDFKLVLRITHIMFVCRPRRLFSSLKK